MNRYSMPWIVRGDIDGFFGLAVDNLVQLLLIDTLCRGVLGFPPQLVYGTVLPAAAISILVGNVAYGSQARALARRTGRTDVCALPYGINTVSLFAHVFLVMLPAKALAERTGAADPVRVAWQAGLLATFATGLIELGSRLRCRTSPQGDAARSAPLDAGRHCPGIHLAGLSFSHVRPSHRRTDHVGRGDADLLRPRAVQGPDTGWRSRRRARNVALLDHRHRSGGRPAVGRGDQLSCPSSWATSRPP